ncbi:MAG: S1 RNA-binding domain-containing protein [Chloroflexi bacterium]|nr:S1 RNA-binding domain-containing protein [Chloroflexota bacterium]
MTSDSPPEETQAMQDMGELLDSMEPLKPLRRGDIVEGIVMRVDSEGILVNIGHKAEGIVPTREMRTLDQTEFDSLGVGDEVVTYVIRPESAEQSAILSIDRALGETGWRDLEKSLEAGETVEGKIIGFNRGGAIVEVYKVQGFVPMSQLVSVSRDIFRDTSTETKVRPPAETAEPPADTQEAEPAASEESEESPEPETETSEPKAETPEPKAESPEPEPEVDLAEQSIGKDLKLKILEVNRSRNRAIFSERQAVQEWRDAQKARLVEELTEGETRRGKVTGISNFGAFVDLGGADGLIHISELSWAPVDKPEDIVKIGQELDVFVLRVDTENKKIALSLRRLQPEPWDTIHERYSVGDLVDARVTKLTNFGAFARVEGNIEGLIHISELTSRVINHPREVVQEGEEVQLKIIRIEPERRRLGLSLKQAAEEEDY